MIRKMNRLFLPGMIVKAKYYPWLMLFLLLLLGIPIIPLLCGILVGYLYSWKMFDYCLNIPQNKAVQMESNWFFSAIKSMTGFVPATDIQAAAINVAAPEPPVPQPQTFSGHGVKLGSEKQEAGSRPVSILVEKPVDGGVEVKPTDGANGPYNIVLNR